MEGSTCDQEWSDGQWHILHGCKSRIVPAIRKNKTETGKLYVQTWQNTAGKSKEGSTSDHDWKDKQWEGKLISGEDDE